MEHQRYMRRAFDLALKHLGNVQQNPIVGAVIVHDNRIIGEGAHEQFGSAHAEVNALKSVKEEDLHLLDKSTMYVTLEPCHHHGNTPPCVNAILKHKIPNVVVSCVDPNPQVYMKSINRMRMEGVAVELGIEEEHGKELIKRYLTMREKKRPYVILKYAQSKDQFIGREGEQVWLTNAISKKLVHKWRAKESAILVGRNTAATDDPSLTTREWTGNHPTRIVLDSRLSLSPNLKVFNGEAPTIVLYHSGDKQPLTKNLEYRKLSSSRFEVTEILEVLYKEHLKSVIIEGGADILSQFIMADLWDEARVFTTSGELKTGIPAPVIHKQPVMKQEIAGDLLEIYRNYPEQ